jgi:ipoprotein LpqH
MVLATVVGCSTGAPTPASAPTATAKLVVDGKPRPIQNKVECVTAANMVMANIGSDQDGVAVTVSTGDNLLLQDFTVVKVDGKPLTYTDSTAGPRPTVTKTGPTYKIVGVAESPDVSGTVSKPFDLEFACPPGH